MSKHSVVIFYIVIFCTNPGIVIIIQIPWHFIDIVNVRKSPLSMELSYNYSPCICEYMHSILNECCMWFSDSEDNFTFLINISLGITLVCLCFIVISCLCLKATIALQRQVHNIEAMKTEMAVTDDQLEGWTTDVNEWAEGIICSLMLNA